MTAMPSERGPSGGEYQKKDGMSTQSLGSRPSPGTPPRARYEAMLSTKKDQRSKRWRKNPQPKRMRKGTGTSN